MVLQFNSWVKETLRFDEVESTKLSFGMLSDDSNEEGCNDLKLSLEVDVFCWGVKLALMSFWEAVRFLEFVEGLLL